MLSRLVIKRFCHTHTRSKCYENIHKIDSLRKDVNETKDLLKSFEQPLMVIYSSSVLSMIASLSIIIKTVGF
jgi:hypothetical protein